MKKLLIVIAAAFAVGGCGTKSNPEPTLGGQVFLVRNTATINVYLFSAKGHEYLVNAGGGMLHAESCPCKRQ